MFTELKNKLRDLGTSPIFFVGSGMSRRYVDGPDWLGLLKKSIEELDINFEKYKQKYTRRSVITNEDEIDLEGLAQKLEDIYFDALPEEKIESDKNKGYYYRKRICEIIEGDCNEKWDEMYQNTEVKELKKTSPAAIITTNYDLMLEKIFGETYTVHVGQTSLLTSLVDGVGDIYKIHGSVEAVNSIVITKEDYDRFFERDIYLNAKLLTLFLEYPIIFLGYSVSDRNVKSVLTTIMKMLPLDKVEELKSRIWFVKRSNSGNRNTTERITLDDGLYIDVKAYELENYEKLYEAINDTSIKKLPVRFLKYLKNSVYELVASQEYNPQLLDVNINDIENIKNFDKGNNFVGLTFSAANRNEILGSNTDVMQAFLKEKSEYDPYNLINYIAEQSGVKRRVPIYKFIANENYDAVVEYIKDKFGEKANIYDRVTMDNENYKVEIGVKKENINFMMPITKENLEKYADEYIEKNDGMYQINKNVIIKYTILDILKNRLEELNDTDTSFICEYRDKIVNVATNLSESYIKEKYNELVKLISSLYSNTAEYKKLLCLIDRSVYREKFLENKGVEGFEEVNPHEIEKQKDTIK